MANKNKWGRLGAMLLALTIFLSTQCVPRVMAQEDDGAIRRLSDLAGETVAVQTGTVFDGLLNEEQRIGGAVAIDYYNSTNDVIEAVKTGKAAATALDLPVAKMYCSRNPELMILPEELDVYFCGFGFSKGSPLVEPFNRALAQMREEGVLLRLEEKWMGSDESVKKLIQQDWQPVNGTLSYWLDTTYEPVSYQGENGILLGYDTDVVLHAAKIMGVGLEFTTCSYDGLIPALVSGKADLACSGMSITEERAQSIDFSDPHYTGSVVVVVRNPDYVPAGDTNRLATLAEKFEATFLKENRWMLFIEGIANTLLITAMSALLGTLLGFGVYMLCRSTPAAVSHGFESVFSLLEHLPIIVLLMILYYVIFGRVEISGVLVSIAAFTLTFTASMYGMLKTGVKAVSFGQTEAAYALGYTKNAAFFKIVLPQAARFFLPSYRSELVSLVKGTAVVGYIAVQDLTKISDIVRSRTFEAFFPLVATAVIYALLAWLMTALIDCVERRLNPKRRSKDAILKGVKLQ